ncbi:MAG: AAA family ATPase [Sarcina sp.]
MSRLFVMVGIPGSGKSFKAKEIKEKNSNSIILSSDEIRKELLNDENNQNNNELVFKTIRKRTRENLDKGVDVIFDATNISAKRRSGFIKQFPRHEAICIFMYTKFINCIRNNLRRDRVVPTDIVASMYKRIDVPMLWEGWSEIKYCTNSLKESFISPLVEVEELEFEEYKAILKDLGLNNCINLGQDSSYHTLSVDRHMYYAYKKAFELTKDKNLIIAAMFHDVGKPHCKNFKEGSKYANFIGHNCVGAYLMVDILDRLGFSNEDIIDITTLINLHMRLHDVLDNYKAKERLIGKIGEEMYMRLVILHNCDILGR